MHRTGTTERRGTVAITLSREGNASVALALGVHGRNAIGIRGTEIIPYPPNGSAGSIPAFKVLGSGNTVGIADTGIGACSIYGKTGVAAAGEVLTNGNTIRIGGTGIIAGSCNRSAGGVSACEM